MCIHSRLLIFLHKHKIKICLTCILLIKCLIPFVSKNFKEIQKQTLVTLADKQIVNVASKKFINVITEKQVVRWSVQHAVSAVRQLKWNIVLEFHIVAEVHSDTTNFSNSSSVEYYPTRPTMKQSLWAQEIILCQ